jgi:hypothetical protein
MVYNEFDVARNFFKIISERANAFLAEKYSSSVFRKRYSVVF